MDNFSRPDAVPTRLGARPAVYGALATLGFCLVLIVAEVGLTAGPFQPGVLLDWAPLVAAGIALFVATRTAGADREALFAGAITALGVFWLLNPAPAFWMPLAPVAAVVLVLAVRLAPATRLVTSPLTLLGLVAALQAIPALANTLAALAAVTLYCIALVARLPRAATPPAIVLPSSWAAFDPVPVADANEQD